MTALAPLLAVGSHGNGLVLVRECLGHGTRRGSFTCNREITFNKGTCYWDEPCVGRVSSLQRLTLVVWKEPFNLGCSLLTSLSPFTCGSLYVWIPSTPSHTLKATPLTTHTNHKPSHLLPGNKSLLTPTTYQHTRLEDLLRCNDTHKHTHTQLEMHTNTRTHLIECWRI